MRRGETIDGKPLKFSQTAEEMNLLNQEREKQAAANFRARGREISRRRGGDTRYKQSFV
jgi:hypothetical protein